MLSKSSSFKSLIRKSSIFATLLSLFVTAKHTSCKKIQKIYQFSLLLFGLVLYYSCLGNNNNAKPNFFSRKKYFRRRCVFYCRFLLSHFYNITFFVISQYINCVFCYFYNKGDYMDISKRIIDTLKKSGKKQVELAKYLKIRPSTISDWKNKGTEPAPNLVPKIAEFLNVSVHYLLTGYEPSQTPSNGTPVDGFIKVPVVGRIPAGDPIIAIENIEDYECIPRNWLNGDTKNYFILRVEGDSMEPIICNGDYVLIKKCPTCDNGQICAVGIIGETPDLYATLKRVYKLDSEYLELIPENNKYPRRKVKMSEVNIFGLVKKSFRNF